MLFETIVDHLEDVGLGAGIVGAERLEILVGLEGVALATQYIAVNHKTAGQPVAMGSV